MVIAIVIMFLYIILFTFGFVSYIFNSIGIYELSKREKEKPYAIAWIPCINKYLLGKLAFKSDTHASILTFLSLGTTLFSFFIIFMYGELYATLALLLISFILSLITAIYCYIARYKIYSKYSKSIILMTVFDIVSCGILGPVFLFAIKDNNKNK